MNHSLWIHGTFLRKTGWKWAVICTLTYILAKNWNMQRFLPCWSRLCLGCPNRFSNTFLLGTALPCGKECAQMTFTFEHDHKNLEELPGGQKVSGPGWWSPLYPITIGSCEAPWLVRCTAWFPVKENKSPFGTFARNWLVHIAQIIFNIMRHHHGTLPERFQPALERQRVENQKDNFPDKECFAMGQQAAEESGCVVCLHPAFHSNRRVQNGLLDFRIRKQKLVLEHSTEEANEETNTFASQAPHVIPTQPQPDQHQTGWQSN